MKVNEYFGDLVIRSVSNCIFEGGKIYPSNTMPDFYALEMIADGETDLFCDGKKMILKGPVIFWIKQTCKRYRFYSRAQQYHHLWIDYYGERGDRIYHFLCKQYPDCMIPLSEEQKGDILPLFLEIKERFSAPEGYDPNEMTLKFEHLLYRITKTGGNEYYAKGDPHRIYQIWETIRRNPFSTYSPTELAAERRISEVYFRMLFQQRFKVPFQRFLQQSRLDYAAMLLITMPQYRIAELSDRCGFANVSGFSNAFHRRFGMSPREYQQCNGIDKLDENQ